MSEQNRPHSLAESISALIDNQASELELQRILKASEQDPEVKATWARYQLAGALLRGDLGRGDTGRSQSAGAPATDLAARISAAIAVEDAPVAVPVAAPLAPKAQQGWFYQLGRVALVASVAGGMVLGVNQFNNTDPTDNVVAANTVVAPAPLESAVSLPSGINSPAINTRTVALQTGYETRPQENRRVLFQPTQAGAAVSDEEVSRYVNQMIKAHSDNAAMNSGQGVLPYARVIITDED